MNIESTISNSYRVVKQTHTGFALFNNRRKLDAPIYHAEIMRAAFEDDWGHIGEYSSEEEAIKACAAHAREEVKFSLESSAGYYPD